jgi:hypothetical protein
VPLSILPRADGGRARLGGGLFSGLGGAGLDDALGIRVIGLQPFITMEEGHGVAVDGLDLHARTAQEGELHIQGEFLDDLELAALVHQTINSIDDEAAGAVFDGD